jgi:DNA-directed RNA polymerase specialized sigma24 family protein
LVVYGAPINKVGFKNIRETAQGRQYIFDRLSRRRDQRFDFQCVFEVAMSQQTISAVAERLAMPMGKDDELLGVHEALDPLAAHDSVKAELVKLRYFMGLTIEQAADVMGISEPTAKRYWAYARAWLFNEIKRGNA